MSTCRRIENLSNGYWIKPSQAERQILNCAAEWVEHGVSIRSLTLAESIAARNVQASKREMAREPLAYAEIPGLSFAPPVSGAQAAVESRHLVREAHLFCAKAA